mgnify:FL=1
MFKTKLALVRTNYSQDYHFYDNGATCEDRDILIPFQLLVLAAAAKNVGIDVKIFDGEIGLKDEEQLASDILEWKPHFVGITVTTPDVPQVSKLCMILREELSFYFNGKSSAGIIVGGCHATAMPKNTLNEIGADFVVKGYGDKAIVEIVKGNCDEGIVEMYPDKFQESSAYSLLDYEDYMFTDPTCGRVKTASVMSAYGCPFRCRFCSHDRNVRFKDIDLFLGEISYLYNIQNIRYFYIYDDTFLLNRERIIKILEGLELFSDAHFQCLTRANLINEEIAERLKEANFVRVSMGLESGSDEILKRVSKGVWIEDAVRACEILHNTGIETRASFILGLPYETHETVNETIEFAKSLELYHANFNIMTPYPGSEAYGMTLRNEGLRFAEKRYETDWAEYRRWGRAIIETDDLTAEDLEDYQVKAQVGFYSQRKIYDYYYMLFMNGNRSRYFYRPLNFAWNQQFGMDVPFWNELDNSKIVGASHELNGKRNQVCDRV